MITMKASTYSLVSSGTFNLIVIVCFFNHIHGSPFPLSGDMYLIAGQFFLVSGIFLRELKK